MPPFEYQGQFFFGVQRPNEAKPNIMRAWMNSGLNKHNQLKRIETNFTNLSFKVSKEEDSPKLQFSNNQYISWKLTYPPPKVYFKKILLFPRSDLLVPWKVRICSWFQLFFGALVKPFESFVKLWSPNPPNQNPSRPHGPPLSPWETLLLYK